MSELKTMTVSRWRENPELVSSAAKILADPVFNMMLAVLKNDAPHNYTLPKLKTTEIDCIRQLGEIDGYNRCVNHLEAMGELSEPAQPLEATFEKPKD